MIHVHVAFTKVINGGKQTESNMTIIHSEFLVVPLPRAVLAASKAMRLPCRLAALARARASVYPRDLELGTVWRPTLPILPRLVLGPNLSSSEGSECDCGIDGHGGSEADAELLQSAAPHMIGGKLAH